MDDTDLSPHPLEPGDGPFTMAGLYRLASTADRAHIDEALGELLHTLDHMPTSVDDQWLTEARYDAEDNHHAFREIRRAEEEQQWKRTWLSIIDR